MDNVLAIAFYFVLVATRIFLGAWFIQYAVRFFQRKQYLLFGGNIMALIYVVIPFIRQLWEGI